MTKKTGKSIHEKVEERLTGVAEAFEKLLALKDQYPPLHIFSQINKENYIDEDFQPKKVLIVGVRIPRIIYSSESPDTIAYCRDSETLYHEIPCASKIKTIVNLFNDQRKKENEQREKER